MSNLPFVEEILADLRRFKECVEDGQDVDLERSRFDLLTQLDLLERTQRSPALWVMTQAGEDAIAQPAAGEPEQQTAINADDLPTKKYPLGAFDFDAPVAAGEPKWSCLNAWFLSLESGRQSVLREDKWMLAGAAFDAGRQCAAQPAAAHGDEAEQYRLLRVGEVIRATDELLRDDCTTWQPMGDGPQVGIGWGWHAGLMPVRRIDAAMRAQGEGEVQ